MRPVLFNILLLFLPYISNAQAYDMKLQISSSADGNCIYLYTADDLANDSLIMLHTASFIIERIDSNTVSSTDDTGKIRIAEVAPVANESELRAIFTEKEIAEMTAFFNLGTPAQLVNYFKTKRDPRDFSLYYTSLKVRQAMGHVYIDRNVKKGVLAKYRVLRKDINNSIEEWAQGIIINKTGNVALPWFKAKHTETIVNDSSVLITWKMPVGKEVVKRIARPKSPLDWDEKGIVWGKQEDGNRLIAAVHLLENGKKIEVEKMLPVLNDSADTVTYTYYKNCLPEENVTTYLVIEDELGNIGLPSDTVNTIVVTQGTLPLIYGLNITEITDGIRLSWDKLPAKTYITGVLITRTDSRDKTDTIARLSRNDTTYTDNNIEPGNIYIYGARALYAPNIAVSQDIPAIKSGSYTKFSLPETPGNLKASNEGRNIRLTWDSSKRKGLYGHYIYRGTSSKNRELVAGPVMQSTFLDTSKSLSGRSKYYYTVVAQNLVQDTSAHSNEVAITPNRGITTAAPANINFYYENDKLNLTWDDIHQYDNAVAGYALQRRSGGDGAFSLLKTTGAEKAGTIDTALKPGIKYQYRVACISTRGDTSDYSEAYEFSLRMPDIDIMSTIYVYNVQEGVAISWPEELHSNRKAYNVYRRISSANEYTKVGNTDGSTFRFTDAGVEEGKTYIYCLSITTTDDREGNKGLTKSIKRVKGPTPAVIGQ